MHNYHNLHVWQEGISLVEKVYKASKNFPIHELYGLTNQMRRASISIPSNIAEGSSRSSKKEFARYLEIAIGSAFEVETQLEIAKRLQYISIDDFEDVDMKLKPLIRQVISLHKNIKFSSK